MNRGAVGEAIARSLTNEGSKVAAMGAIAGALAATDPGRAARVLADAEAIARSLTNEGSKVAAMGAIAEALAATDPGRIHVHWRLAPKANSFMREC